MSFGQRLSALLLLFVLTCIFPVPGQAGNGAPQDRNMLIKFFQEHISPVDGGRCPMTPSCSEYAARAIEKHGPVIGWIMACDRLQRCGHDEIGLSPQVRIKGRDYTLDPVSSNDFWWFSPVLRKPLDVKPKVASP